MKVNGASITGLTPLSNGTRIRVGRTVFRYEVPHSERLELLKARSTARRETVQIPTSRPNVPPPQMLEEDEPTEEITG